MTELFTILENGQLEVNFESLELITSAEFIEMIKEDIKDGFTKVVEIKETERTVRVKTMYKKCSLTTHIFYKSNGHYDWDQFGYSDIQEYIKYGGEI